jgi:hypothetical protein
MFQIGVNIKKIFVFVFANHNILKWDIIKAEIILNTVVSKSDSRFTTLSLFTAIIFE